MKKFSFILFILISTLYSCGGDDVIPTPPKPPIVPIARKLWFRCDKHNLSYRFSQYTDDKYKTLKMPCPICKYDSAMTFMAANQFSSCQLLCPIDSTITSFNISNSEKEYLLRNKEPFFPVVPLVDSFKGFTLSYLKNAVVGNSNKDFSHFPDCWCEACFSKVRIAAIKIKEDSVVTFHSMINGLVGIDKYPYPINNGVPVDRRVRAKAILDSIEAIMPQLTTDYKKEYNTLDCFVGYFNRTRQRYIYSQKTGTPIDSWVSEDIAYKKVASDAYIGDTVVINIGGGPEYQRGEGALIDLYKAKGAAYVSPNKVRAVENFGSKNLIQGTKLAKRVNTKTSSQQYQLSTNFIPGKIDFLPSEYLPRKYNTYSTSVFTLFQPQKGNAFYSDNTMGSLWSYVDLGKSIGGWNNKFPNNIVSVETAELINDIGVMEIRKVVEWCKARNKKMVIMGTSWGGAMIMRYLLYYPASDFDFIFIADQNPNIQQEIVEKDYEYWIYNTANMYGTTNYLEINKNMCVLSSSPYRRLNWLKNQNLGNTVFYCVENDYTLGTIPSSDITTLKSQGAKVYKFPNPIAHGAFHDIRAWNRTVIPTQM